MKPTELGTLLASSLRLACGQSDDDTLSLARRHRGRSSAWVTALALHFRRYYEGAPDIRVFIRGDASGKQDFGLTELLHDIAVVRCATVPAPFHTKYLAYVSEAIWQVESEFARNGRAAIIDFSKLVLGSALNKLFTFANVANQDAFVAMLLEPALACSGDVFVASVPHPDAWYGQHVPIRLWQLDRVQKRWDEEYLEDSGHYW